MFKCKKMGSTEEEYPKTVQESIWIQFLGRSLESFEKQILHDVAVEIMFNKEKMGALYNKLMVIGLTIPELTSLNGNCFFESLAYHGFVSDTTPFRSDRTQMQAAMKRDSMILRRAVAQLMYQFKDLPNFIPGQPLSLGQLFEMELYEQIQYVYCKQKKKLMRNTYELMCMDLSTPGSWSILPTNLIMLLISRLFRIRFEFIKDTDETDHTFRVIDAYENVPEEERPAMRTIKLAHILEAHFLPVGTLMENTDILYYKNAKTKFCKWGSVMQAQKKKQKEQTKKSLSNSFGGFLGFTDIAT